MLEDESREVGREAAAAFHRQFVSSVSLVSADMFSPGPGSRLLVAPSGAPARGASSLMPASANNTQARSAVEQRGLSTWSKAALHQLSTHVNLRTATAVVRAGPGPLRRLARNAGMVSWGDPPYEPAPPYDQGQGRRIMGLWGGARSLTAHGLGVWRRVEGREGRRVTKGPSPVGMAIGE